MQSVLYNAAGHRRSPVTMPAFHEGRTPRNKGRRYPADPPTVEEIIAVMRQTGGSADGARVRALIVVLWRAGLRIGEALDLSETDLDAARCSCGAGRVAVVVRSGSIAGHGHGWSRGWCAHPSRPGNVANARSLADPWTPSLRP
jgi:site-specific recombinase XerC